MKTLEDLKRIREQALQTMKVREGEQSTRIVVAMGTCGIASGAREVMAAILDELANRGITQITVTQTGCKGLCEKEPTVDVTTAGGPTVTYGYVTEEKARTIVEKHVVGGQIVGDWVVATS
jgi:(2Fe-2S) ferredoxin